MDMAKDEQARLIAAAREWVRRDPLDPYRQHILDAVLDHNGPQALEALQMEMDRNP